MKTLTYFVLVSAISGLSRQLLVDLLTDILLFFILVSLVFGRALPRDCYMYRRLVTSSESIGRDVSTESGV